MSFKINTSCSCSNTKKKSPNRKINVLNIFSAIIFFLFPKCPICWAAYASLFSFLGFEQIKFNSNWNYLILTVFIIGSVYSLYKYYRLKLWINFSTYCVAVGLLLFAYILDYDKSWWLYAVVILMLFSSFYYRSKHSFLVK